MAEIKLEEQSEKAKGCRENSWDQNKVERVMKTETHTKTVIRCG